MRISVYRVGIKVSHRLFQYNGKSLYWPRYDMYRHISTALMITKTIKIHGFIFMDLQFIRKCQN